jgi:excisionase family DNA binding protein
MKVFSTQEVAQYLKFSPRTILRLVAKKQMPAKRWRGVLRFGKDTIDKFLTGDYHYSIRNKCRKVDSFKEPMWEHPMTVLTPIEAATFLRISPSALRKDEDWNTGIKKIGKQTRYIKETLIDWLTREMHVSVRDGLWSWIHWYNPKYHRTITILKTEEAAEALGLSKRKCLEMLEARLIQCGTIGRQRRFVKEYLEDQLTHIRNRMGHLRSGIGHYWAQIEAPYTSMKSLEFELDNLRRYCDDSNTKRGG